MSYCLIENVSYGNHERQRFDLFIPEKAKSVNGVIFYIHGGGWQSGDKSCHHPDCIHFCDLGYICATMNYRYVSENVTVFDELVDVSSALEAVKFECGKRGFDIEKALLSGASAGGHLSLLYAYAKNNSASVTPVAACVYCPPVDCSAPDFLFGINGEFDDWKYDLLSKSCGVRLTKDSYLNAEPQTALKKISPAEYVSVQSVPTAAFHGKNDDLVPLSQSLDLVACLESVGVKNDLLIYKNSGHTLDKDPECADKAKEIIFQYAKKYL